jgi:hypothetical protein
VVDELAEVRETGGHLGWPRIARRHRVGEPAPQSISGSRPARTDAGEAEGWRGRRGRDDGSGGVAAGHHRCERDGFVAPAAAFGQQPLADDEVALGTVSLHRRPPPIVAVANPGRSVRGGRGRIAIGLIILPPSRRESHRVRQRGRSDSPLQPDVPQRRCRRIGPPRTLDLRRPQGGTRWSKKNGSSPAAATRQIR